MVDYRILKKLTPITAEEKEILAGGNKINPKLYMTAGGDAREDVVSSRLMLEKGKLITARTHTRFVDFPEHSHDYIELVYMCSGSTRHIIGGREVQLAEGELLFLSRRAKHAIRRAEESDIAVNFIVLPAFFADVAAVLGEEDTPLKDFITDSLCGSGGPDFLHFKVAEVLPVQNLMENLIWTLLRDTKNKRSVMRATMELLFMQLLSCTDALEGADPKDEAVLFLLRYIEDNYREGSLQEAARLLHCDFCWLSKEVKKRTSMTYTELVQKKRLSQAAFYLKNTNMTVSAVAASVGYENIRYFYQVFTQRYGVTPKGYRDEQKMANKDNF